MRRHYRWSCLQHCLCSHMKQFAAILHHICFQVPAIRMFAGNIVRHLTVAWYCHLRFLLSALEAFPLHGSKIFVVVDDVIIIIITIIIRTNHDRNHGRHQQRRHYISGWPGWAFVALLWYRFSWQRNYSVWILERRPKLLLKITQNKLIVSPLLVVGSER